MAARDVQTRQNFSDSNMPFQSFSNVTEIMRPGCRLDLEDVRTS